MGQAGNGLSRGLDRRAVHTHLVIAVCAFDPGAAVFNGNGVAAEVAGDGLGMVLTKRQCADNLTILADPQHKAGALAVHEVEDAESDEGNGHNPGNDDQITFFHV